jgi:hypothetical protein
MSLTDLARVLEMSVAGVGFAVEREEGISARQKHLASKNSH